MKLIYDFLPSYTQEIVKKCAAVYQIDRDYALTALFAAVAAALGDRYQIIDPKGYVNAVALWLCQLGISGYGKTDCGSFMMAPLVKRDSTRHIEYIKEKKRWQSLPPEKRGPEPVEDRLIVNDYTPEALFDAMEHSGVDGIILYRDELQGWLKDIGRYGKSGEVEQYLTAWSQKPIRVTRLGRPDNLIERPCFTIFGGLQPDLIPKMLGNEDLIANGFNARFLFVFADETFPLEYYRDSISSEMKEAYKNLIDRLLEIPHTDVKFSYPAEQSYIKYWSDLQSRKAMSGNMIRAMLSKLQIYVEKWAGIIELLANDGTPCHEISGTTMDIAIAHMRIFEEWALKAYDYFLPTYTPLLPRTLNKTETLQMLKKHYPNMKKNLVAQGLGISPSLLSRDPNKATPPEVNVNNEVSS